MHDFRTGSIDHFALGNPLGFAKRAPRLALWWVLWCLLASVDIVGANDDFKYNPDDNTFSGYSNSSSGRLCLGSDVIVTCPVAFRYRRLESTAWYSKAAGSHVFFRWDPANVSYGLATIASWSGLTKDVGTVNCATPLSGSQTYAYQFAGDTSEKTFTVRAASMGGCTVSYLAGAPSGSSNQNKQAGGITVTLPSSLAGEADVNDPNIWNPPPPPPPPSTFPDLEGKILDVPYYVEGGAGNVEVEIGGQNYSFPVDVAPGDSGGVANLKVPIPSGWDGTAKINGAAVNLAARAGYSGNPSMQLLSANPYTQPADPLPVPLPPGMTAGGVTLPAGMTPGVPSLPAGMIAGAGLPLPSGVAAIYAGSPVDNKLPVGMVKDDGTKTYSVAPSVSGTATGTPAGSSVAVSSGVVVGSTTSGNDLEDQAIVDASLASPGEAKGPSSGLAGLGTTWDSLKTQVQNKFGAFQPMATGNLPKASSLDLSLNFGPLGIQEINLDLTQSPFSTARALSLVLVSMHAAWFFVKYIKV